MIVFIDVFLQNPLQMLLIHNDNMIKTISPECPNHSFDIWILPRRSGRNLNFIDIQSINFSSEFTSVNPIPIPDHVFRCSLERKCFNDLLPCPSCLLENKDFLSVSRNNLINCVMMLNYQRAGNSQISRRME